MKATVRAALGNARNWWPEGICAALCIAIGLSSKGIAPAIGLACFIGAGWAMGFRKRHRPLWEVLRRMDAKLDAALADDDEPVAEVRHLHSV